jgi:hypothetical protein
LIYSLRESDTHLQQLYKCYIIFVDGEYSFEKVKYSIKTQLRKVVTEKDRNKFKEKLSSYSDESKLFLYSKLKSSIGFKKVQTTGKRVEFGLRRK